MLEVNVIVLGEFFKLQKVFGLDVPFEREVAEFPNADLYNIVLKGEDEEDNENSKKDFNIRVYSPSTEIDFYDKQNIEELTIENKDSEEASFSLSGLIVMNNIRTRSKYDTIGLYDKDTKVEINGLFSGDYNANIYYNYYKKRQQINATDYTVIIDNGSYGKEFAEEIINKFGANSYVQLYTNRDLELNVPKDNYEVEKIC